MFTQRSHFLAPRTGPRRVVALALVAAVVAMRVYAMPASADIDATVTSDNAYSFGWGDNNDFACTGCSYVGPSVSTLAGHFTGCPPGPGPNYAGGVESYTISSGAVLPNRYLYVIAYSDDATWQGVLGTFKDTISGYTIDSGDPRWSVCATGENFDGNAASPEDVTANVPSEAKVAARIQDCNRWTAAGGGPADTSGGWVDQTTNFGQGTFHVGGPNDATAGTGFSGAANTAPWGQITCITSSAHWMWFNGDPTTITDPIRWQCATADCSGGHKEFLIFRTPLQIAPECPKVVEPIVECLPGAMGPSGCYSVTAMVVNDTTAPIDAVLVQGHGATPSVITINPPLAPGDGRSITVTICPDASVITAGVASLTFIFPGRHECCRQEVRFELPDCGTDYCFGIPRVWAECVPGDANAIDLKFEFDPPPGGGGTLHIGGGLFTPDMIPIPLGDTNLVIGPLHIADAPGPMINTSTGAITRRYCTTLYMTPDGETGTCCQERVCFDLPTCGLPATPFSPPPGGTPDPTTAGLDPDSGSSR